METIGWEDFAKVELRVGRIVSTEPFPQAHNPAYKLVVDFGPEPRVQLGVPFRRTLLWRLELLVTTFSPEPQVQLRVPFRRALLGPEPWALSPEP